MNLTQVVRLSLFFASVLVSCLAGGCGKGRQAATAAVSTGEAPAQTEMTAANKAADSGKSTQRTEEPVDPIVTVHTTAGDMKLRLFAQKAPQTVDNFLSNYV